MREPGTGASAERPLVGSVSSVFRPLLEVVRPAPVEPDAGRGRRIGRCEDAGVPADPVPLLAPDDIRRFAEALGGGSYTHAGIAALVGPSALGSLQRGDVRPALVAAAGAGDPPLATLLRLFIGGGTEPVAAVRRALDPLPLDAALAGGLLERHSDGIRAAVDVRPHSDEHGSWWVVADLGNEVRPGPLPADHVLGVGASSVTLAEATVRPKVATALDLGVGCGVQSLHLSRHVEQITGTDLNRRALRFAATTAALNGLDWELLGGDLAVPVTGRRFDLVVSNPPFVIGNGETTHTYRDSGRAGDAVCAELIAAAPRLLAPGGTLQLLANWLHVQGERWDDRVHGWIEPTGLDAWAVQREVTDPGSYVALWLRDAGEDHEPDGAAAERIRRWSDWFAANRVEGIGFGIVTLAATGSTDPVIRVEEMRQPIPAVPGTEIAAWFERMAWLRGVDLLAARLVTAPELRLRQIAGRGEAGWAVDSQLLALDAGLRWTEPVDPVLVQLVGGCDGTVTVGDQLAVLAAAYDSEPAAVTAMALPVVAHLVERGMLRPV
jgi:methylase of polypeptide subunit release factors